MDYWFAECLPCKWQAKHPTEEAAIAAAEEHVFTQHARVPAAERREKHMGHVQLRTEGAIGTDLPPTSAELAPAGEPAAELPPATFEGEVV